MDCTSSRSEACLSFGSHGIENTSGEIPINSLLFHTSAYCAALLGIATEPHGITSGSAIEQSEFFYFCCFCVFVMPFLGHQASARPLFA